MITTEKISEIKQKIEDYRHTNFYSMFPSGPVPEWVYTAVIENIITPMQDEIDFLKSEILKTNKN